MMPAFKQVFSHQRVLAPALRATRYTHRAAAGAAATPSSSSSWFSFEWFTATDSSPSSSSCSDESSYRYQSTVASKWSNSALAGPCVGELADEYGVLRHAEHQPTIGEAAVRPPHLARYTDVEDRPWLLQETSTFWSRWFSSLFKQRQQQQQQDNDAHPLTQLPRTFRDALRKQNGAIVITTATAPHKVVHVNQGWTDLCGYTKPEALDQDLCQLIQGPNSNTDTAARMVHRLLETKQPQEAYLINYSKNQRQFTNHVAVGTLSLNDDDPQRVDLLVGVLQEVVSNDGRTSKDDGGG